MTTEETLIESTPRNTRHATGPRTPEGKARSAQNARKHGLSAAQLKLAEEDKEIFESLQNELRDAIRPEGELENSLTDQAIFAQWNIRRARILEEAYFAEDPTAQNEARLRAIDRHARRHQASFHRAMREIACLQTERACRETAPIAAAALGPQNELECVATPPPLAATLPVLKARRERNRLLTGVLDLAFRAAAEVPPPGTANADS